MPEERGPDSGGLKEVEQALSVLAGRDPRAAQAEREAREAREKKANELRALEKKERARRSWMIASYVAIAAAVFAVAFVFWGFHSRAKDAEESLSPLTKPFEDRGFVRAPSPYFSAPTRIEQDVPEDSCIAIVPSPKTTSVRLERPSASPDVAKGTMLHCTCAAEHVIASTDDKEGAIALLHVDAKSIGGVHGAALFDPHPAMVTPGGETCADEHLDAFVASGKFPKSPPSPEWKKGPLASLAAIGFESVARMDPDRPLALLESSSDKCFVASAESGDIALRVGDKIEVEHAHIGWCAQKLGATMIDRRNAKGVIDVVSIPVRRIGGLFGLVRALPDVEPWTNDHAHSASETLHAALVPDVTPVPDGLIPLVPTARVVALSVGVALNAKAEAAYGADPGSPAYFVCDPSIRSGVREVLCVQNAAQTWHAPAPGVPQGAAFGSLPPWMSAIAQIKDPDVVSLELQLIEHAIDLSARGFEATVIEGVTETEDGVTIIGRAGEDSIVAIGIWPAAPWVEPYGEWTLGSSPAVIPLAAATRTHLAAKDKTTAPLAQRRTVVFRHATK